MSPHVDAGSGQRTNQTLAFMPDTSCCSYSHYGNVAALERRGFRSTARCRQILQEKVFNHLELFVLSHDDFLLVGQLLLGFAHRLLHRDREREMW